MMHFCYDYLFLSLQKGADPDEMVHYAAFISWSAKVSVNEKGF